MQHDIDITLAQIPAESPAWLRAEIAHSLALLSALDALEHVADANAFQHWFHTRLLPLFPCQHAIIGVIELEHGQPRVDSLLLQQLPSGYQAQLIDANGYIRSPLLCQWLARPIACWLPQAQLSQHPDQHWRTQLAAAGLHNLLAHGFRSQDETRFCFVALYNLPENNGSDYGRWLNLLLPNLQRTAMRLCASLTASNCPLSERERQIAAWLKSGKNNREIAQILHLSEFTVKTHLQNIRAKLGVKTRAQIVAQLSRWLACLTLPQMLGLAECSVWRIYPHLFMPISSGLL